MTDLPKRNPEVAAQNVLDDILASPQKEGLARKAFEAESREIASDNESYQADYQIGDAVINKVYGTSPSSMDDTMIEQVCKPLGFVPFYDEEHYNDEQMSISAGVPQMTRRLGRIARQHFDPDYKPAPIEPPKSEHELLSESQQRMRQQEGYREPGVKYASLDDLRAPSCETREIVTGEGDAPLVRGVTPRPGA